MVMLAIVGNTINNNKYKLLNAFVYTNINRDCIKIEDEYHVDLTDSINMQNVFCLNESVSDAGKKVFKRIEDIMNKETFVCSNKGDPEMLFYIPFNSMVNIKLMTMVGGEEDTAPLHVKLYANKDNPDFSLIEDCQCTQEFECIENSDGSASYELKPSKFKSITSLTIIIVLSKGADYSKIYSINFTGTRTKVRILLFNYLFINF